MRQRSYMSAVAAMAVLAGCASTTAAPDNGDKKGEQAAKVTIDPNPFPSTYKPLPSEATLITNVSIYDGKGGMIRNGSVLMQNGDIAAVGTDVAAPAGANIIDGQGKWVTPGIIDVHSHLGVYASPGVQAHSDGNEVTSPNTAQVWAEHAVWPHDPGFGRAMAGGVTSLQILPGSANLFGGRSVTLKNVPARSMQGMKFPDAPYGMKMACGENPKRVYGSRGGPGSRMGNVAGYRAAWAKAADYKKQWDDYEASYADGKDANVPKRDLQMETLKGVLDGDIRVHMHCYRADEMVVMLDVAQEFDYRITSFQHAVESYKVADILAEHGVCSAMWADWWGFKMEAYDGIRENIPFVHNAGACAIVHSDSAIGIQRLNQEAAKALGYAKKVGIDIPKATAWTWLSLNPAKSLGIDDQTGSLEAGKDADVVLWTHDPFSVYAKAEKVYVDGALVFDLNDPRRQPLYDFELGQPGEGDAK